MKKYLIILITGLLLLQFAAVQADVAAELQAEYAKLAADEFSAVKGQDLWNQGFADPKSGRERSCALCHTSDIHKPGKHARTGKAIEPMAPSVNPQRLTDAGKIEKWFKRNCNWTLGRECTPQEKGDLLVFISSQQ